MQSQGFAQVSNRVPPPIPTRIRPQGQPKLIGQSFSVTDDDFDRVYATRNGRQRGSRPCSSQGLVKRDWVRGPAINASRSQASAPGGLLASSGVDPVTVRMAFPDCHVFLGEARARKWQNWWRQVWCECFGSEPESALLRS